MDVTPGELANIDTSNRLVIPKGVWKAVPWWKRTAMEVKGELVRAGLVRIYSIADCNEVIAKLATDAADIETVTAMIDRYRNLKVTDDGRLQLTKEVTMLLGFTLGDRPPLYSQAAPEALLPPTIEIMSLTYRHERLSKVGEPLLRFRTDK